ncbi:MAG: hypothetical protein QNK37_25950 [Acidobacteriota bacterium]|nr:hypothetical protein [Acidobacteriota bacterium]
MSTWLDISLGEDLLKALKELAAHFGNWKTAVKWFVSYLENGAATESEKLVEETLKKVGLGDALDKVKDFWNDLSDQNKALLQTLDKVEGEQVWPLWEPAKKLGSMSGPLKTVIDFNAAGSVHAELEVASHETLQQMGETPVQGQSVLRFGIDGSVSAGVKVSGSYGGFLSAGVNASGSASAELDYFFSRPSDDLLIEAVAGSLPHLVSPFAPRKIAGGFAHDLEAVNFKLTGSADLGANIQAGYGWGKSFSVRSVDGATSNDVSVGIKASAGYSANLKLDGSFAVLVRPLDEDTLFIRLIRTSARNSTHSLNLNADIGITGLDKVGSDLMTKYMPDATDLINELKPWLDIAGMVREELGEQLDDLLDPDGSHADLVSALSDTLVGDGTAEQLAALVTGALVSAADKEVDLLAADTETKAAALAEQAADELGLTGNTRKEFIDAATKEAGKLIDKLKESVKVKVGELVNGQSGNLKKLFSPLEAIGARVKDLVRDVQTAADKLLKPVLQFLDRYQKIRTRVSNALAGAAKVKIGLAYTRTLSTIRTSDSLLELELETASPRAVEAYKTMLTGTFEKVLALGNEKNGPVRVTGGKLQKMLTRKLSTDFSFSIGDLKMGSSKMLASTVTASYDITGGVLIANSRGDFERAVQGFRESRSISFVNTLELPGSTDADGPVKLMSAGLTISYNDEDLHAVELKQFLGSLENRGLVSPGATVRTIERFREMEVRGTSKRRGAVIGLSLPLSSDNIQALIGKDARAVEGAALANQMSAFFSSEKLPRFVEVVLKWDNPRGSSSGNVYDQLRAMPDVRIRELLDGNRAGGNRAENEYFLKVGRSMAKRARGFVTVVETLKKAAETDPETVDNAIDTFNDYNKTINKELKAWLKVRGLVGGLFNESVPKPTLAFIATLSELIDLDDDDAPLIPVIQWQTTAGAETELAF